MRLGIIGLGYVGITSLAAFARDGHQLIGYESNSAKLNSLKSGKIPITEPEVNNLLLRFKKKIKFTKRIDESVNKLDCLMVSVGTPTDDNGKTDLSSVRSVINELSLVCKNQVPILIRSTCPIGTTRQLRSEYPDLNLNFHPEFLREGSAISDFFDPPKIILGINEKERDKVTKTFNQLYTEFDNEKFIVSYEVAESVKYVDNMFHALKVTFTNEVSKVIAKKKADPSEVMEIFCSDRRLNISDAYLKPGFAYGGSCLEKDLFSFRIQAKGENLPLLEAISKSNQALIDEFFERINDIGTTFIFNGLAFKEETDDLRRSPFVTLAKKLLEKEKIVICFDKNLDTCFGESLHILKNLQKFPNFSLNSSSTKVEDQSILIMCHRDKHPNLPIDFAHSFDLFFGGDILGVFK